MTIQVLNYLMQHPDVMTLQLETAVQEVLKYVDAVSEASVLHTLRGLGQTYYDTTEITQHLKLVECLGDTLVVLPVFERLRQLAHFRPYLEDILRYGLVRYQEEFGSMDYGVPFLKLYESYTMKEVAKVTNYDKKHSAFRGSGLLTYQNDFFLFVDLHKEEDIKESINYQDHFISPDTFQWQSPNATTQESERGQNLVHHQEKGIRLHLFVRKFKKIDKEVQSYIYIGKGNTILATGNKPITMHLALEHRVPDALYREFNYKV